MKKILFVSGTRADFGKLKPLIRAVDKSEAFEWSIFATGMHMLARYGFTVDEIYKSGFKNVYAYMSQFHGESMDMVTANTIIGLSRYVQEYEPDLIVVHGDRVEALAGAIVGALRNILVGHIEGGELSGTVDELIRHSVTKLSHIHFVANSAAANRLIQLGEDANSIYTIGSPDIDLMISPDLPDLKVVKSYYQIDFNTFAIALLHPVTTELDKQEYNANVFADVLLASKLSYILIYPNNDKGCEAIFQAFQSIEGNDNILVFPSLRFEYFLTLLKNAEFIIGNSSAGIREAPFYAVPTVNLGSRQRGRFNGESIINAEFDRVQILRAIDSARDMKKNLNSCNYYGEGESAKLFMEILGKDDIWKTSKQKTFFDMEG